MEAANLAAIDTYINGDMIMVAQGILEAIQETLSSPAISKQRAEQLLRNRDVYLRYARQIDRFAQITRQPAPKPRAHLLEYRSDSRSAPRRLCSRTKK